MDDQVTVDRFLHAFIINPAVRYDHQHPNEKIVLLLRAHPVTQLPWIFNMVVFLVVVAISYYFASLYLSPGELTTVAIFLLVFIASYGWFNFVRWYFNVGIITNERIIDIDFINLLRQEVSEARLQKIEDVTFKSGGYFGSLFNYGKVFIQTAGTEVNIEFDEVPDPAEVIAIINKVLTP